MKTLFKEGVNVLNSKLAYQYFFEANNLQAFELGELEANTLLLYLKKKLHCTSVIFKNTKIDGSFRLMLFREPSRSCRRKYVGEYSQHQTSVVRCHEISFRVAPL